MSANNPIDVLEGVTTDYYDGANRSLLDRWRPMADWVSARIDADLYPYCKATTGPNGPRSGARTSNGRELSGINLASQDYLSLTSHPLILSAVKTAVDRHGVHAAGSAALMGLSQPTVDLERKVAQFLGVADATVFPTGWGAGYGTIKALVRPTDVILIDMLAHASLQEAAAAATPDVRHFAHCSTNRMERLLRQARKDKPNAGILIVTEGVYSMDSDIPDLPALQALAHQYGATLFVDVAHDLGALGPNGRGVIGLQGMVGRIDVVMGCFSKCFAANGGFVASSHPALKYALRFGAGPQTFSTALSPLQASAALAAIEIVEGPDGDDRRARLMRNIQQLRGGMAAEGFTVLGQPSAIVPIRLGGNAFSRRITAKVLSGGGIVNLIEYPAVARNGCRWRLQVMADHAPADISEFIAIATRAKSDLVAATDDAETDDEAQVLAL